MYLVQASSIHGTFQKDVYGLYNPSLTLLQLEKQAEFNQKLGISKQNLPEGMVSLVTA